MNAGFKSIPQIGETITYRKPGDRKIRTGAIVGWHPSGYLVVQVPGESHGHLVHLSEIAEEES